MLRYLVVPTNFAPNPLIVNIIVNMPLTNLHRLVLRQMPLAPYDSGKEREGGHCVLDPMTAES